MVERADEMILNEPREILFRGKRRHRPNKWIYGFPIKRSFAAAISSNNDFQYYPVYPKTIGQYTGLRDRNGKEIFEHDIVKFWHKGMSIKDKSIGRIAMMNGKWSVLWNGELGEYISDLCNCFSIEILGNLFDDFKLLEEQI